jgi:hypothetical protein
MNCNIEHYRYISVKKNIYFYLLISKLYETLINKINLKKNFS